MDRGYLDFELLYSIHQSAAFFIIRSKANTQMRRLYSAPVDKSTGLRCDQIVVPTGFYTKKYYSEKLRRVKFLDDQQKRHLVFLTNHFKLPTLTIAELYRCRWKKENDLHLMQFEVDPLFGRRYLFELIWIEYVLLSYFSECLQSFNSTRPVAFSRYSQKGERQHNLESVKVEKLMGLWDSV